MSNPPPASIFDHLCSRYRDVYHGQNIHNPTAEQHPPRYQDVLQSFKTNDEEIPAGKLRMYVTQVYVLGFELWMTGYTASLETVAVEVRPFHPCCFIYIPSDQRESEQEADEEYIFMEITRILTQEKEKRCRERDKGEKGKKPKSVSPLAVETQQWHVCPHATPDGNQKQTVFKLTLPSWYMCKWLADLVPREHAHWRVLHVAGVTLDLSFIIEQRIDLCQWCEIDVCASGAKTPLNAERKTTAMQEYICPATSIAPLSINPLPPPPPLFFHGFDIETVAERAVAIFQKNPEAQQYVNALKQQFHAVRYDQLDAHIKIPTNDPHLPPDEAPVLETKIGKRPLFVIPKATRVNDCIVNIVSQFWLYGGGPAVNGKVFLRVSHILKGTEPPPHREFEAAHKLTYSFDHEADLIRSWVLLFRDTFDVEWLTGHNIINYDVPYIFQRAVTLNMEDEIAQKLTRHKACPAYVQELLKKKGGEKNKKDTKQQSIRIIIPGAIQFDTMNVVKDKGDVRLPSYALSSCLKVLKTKKPRKKRDLPYYLLAPFHALDACTRWELDCYNDADVNAVRDLVQQLYLPNSLLSMACITSTNINDILLRGLSLRCFRQQIRKMYDEGFLLDHVQREQYQTKHMQSMAILAQSMKLQNKTEAREKSRVKRNEDCLMHNRRITDFLVPVERRNTSMKTSTNTTSTNTTSMKTTRVKKRTYHQTQIQKTNGEKEGQEDKEEEDGKRKTNKTIMKRKREKAYKGARVIPVKKGNYNQPVATLDFSSLYPTIMIGYKLCYNTFIPHEMRVDWDRVPRSEHSKIANDPEQIYFPTLLSKNHHQKRLRLWFLNELDLNRLNVTPPTYDPATEMLILVVGVGRERTCWVQSWPAIIAKSLSECLAQRKRAKDEMEAAKAKNDETLVAVKNGDQLAVKRQANSQYGFFGTIGGPSDFIMESQAICQIGRILNHFMEQVALKPPYNRPSIYGDTDSIMPKFPPDYTKEQIEKECKEIARIVTQACPRPIELTYEKLMGCSTFYANKNYAYWLVWPLKSGEPPLCTRGLSDTRRNYCRLVRELSKTVLTLLHDPNLSTPANLMKSTITVDPTTTVNMIQASERVFSAYDQHVYDAMLPFPVKAALSAVRDALSLLIERKAKVEDVEITVQLATAYEGKAEVVQKELLRKLQSREIDVDAGARIAYVILDIPGAKLFEQAETADHVRDNPQLKLNWKHYIKHMEAPMLKLFKYHLDTTNKRALLTHLFHRAKRLS